MLYSGQVMMLHYWYIQCFLFCFAPNIISSQFKTINANFAAVLKLVQSVPKTVSVALAYLTLASLSLDLRGKESSNTPRNRHLWIRTQHHLHHWDLEYFSVLGIYSKGSVRWALQLQSIFYLLITWYGSYFQLLRPQQPSSVVVPWDASLDPCLEHRW